MYEFTSNEEESLFYAESALEDKLMHNEMCNLFDMYDIAYLEEGESATDSTKVKGVGGKLVDGILRIIEKIRKAVTGIIEGFKSAFTSDKKRLTAEEYMAADSTQEKLMYDINAMVEQVDEEYRLARPLIGGISSITKMDTKTVEELCDKLDGVVGKGYQKARNLAVKGYENKGKIAKSGAVKILANKLISNSEAIKKSDEEYNKHMIAMKARKLNDIDFQNMKKIDRVLMSVNRLVQKWDRVGRKVSKFL